MKVEILVCKQVATTNTIKLTSDHILEFLKDKIPKGVVVTVSFQVPGGGDYSGSMVPLEGDDCLWVQWNEYKVEDTRG